MNATKVISATLVCAGVLLGADAMAQDGGRAISKTTISLGTATPSADEIARIRARHSFLKPLTVPANSYPGQSAPINSMGSWSFVLTRADLPDDVAYHLARTLHGAEKAFCAKLAQACETTAANTLAAAPDAALIHPGVMKYLKEIGAAK